MDVGTAEHWELSRSYECIFSPHVQRDGKASRRISYEDRGCDLVGKGLPGRCKAQDSVSITAKTKSMNRTTKHQELIVKRELNNMSRGLSESRILTKVLTYVPNSEMRRVQLQIISRGNIISLMLLPGSAFNNAPFIIHSLPHSEYLWFQ